MDNRWGTFCTTEEDEQSHIDNPFIHCLTRGEAIGLAVRVLLPLIVAR
jgi:hypothetical protein